jgi:hypothetical protein
MYDSISLVTLSTGHCCIHWQSFSTVFLNLSATADTPSPHNHSGTTDPLPKILIYFDKM